MKNCRCHAVSPIKVSTDINVLFVSDTVFVCFFIVNISFDSQGHVEEDYQNEYFVDSKSPADQTIQYFDNNLNRQKNQEHYGLTSTAAYAHDFSSHNLIIQQSDGDKSIEQENLPNNEIDVPELNVPQGQDIQKSNPRSIIVLPDASHLYSESEIKRIRSLPIMEKSKIVPRNLLERIVYELSARNIPRQKFARIVLGRAQNIFYDMSRSLEDWDKLGRKRREQYENMKEWLNMSEDEKIAAVERENKDERSRNVLTQAQRDALKCHFKKFPEARKRELVGLADQLRLPWKVVTKFFSRLRTNRKHQTDQQQ